MDGAEILSIQRKVNRGVKWLDKNIGRKKWAKKIKVKQLDLQSPNTCMIGEVLGGYDELENKFGVDNDSAVELGFFVDKDHTDHENAECVQRGKYSVLTALWVATLQRLGISKAK